MRRAATALLLSTALLAVPVAAHADVVANATVSVADVSPLTGTVDDVVSVTGTGLLGVSSVRFGDLAARFTVTDDQHLSTTVPAGVTTGPVALATPDGLLTVATFTVQPAVTRLALTLTPATVDYPQPVGIEGRLTRADGSAVSGEPVQMWVKDPGLPWWRIGTLRTDAAGGIAYRYRPAGRTAVQLVYAGDAWFAGSATPGAAPQAVDVRPLLTVSAPTVLRLGVPGTATGRLAPAVSGALLSLTRWDGTAWRPVAAAAADAADATGRFSLPLPADAVGSARYRVEYGGDPAHVAAASAPLQVDVYERDLGPGATGPDVLALQRRLHGMHYDVPTMDGRFGSDTQHAVLAFQKAQGIGRTGVVDAATRTRLAAPRAVTVLHRVSGPSVEVDLTRQVLLYAVDGVVQRVVDVSTGSGQYYTGSDGSRQLAATPLGAWHVVYKVDRWVSAPLGLLYRPAYFNLNGYAIHGSPSVPAYPASHGCVRVTTSAMDRLYALLTVGTPVWVYRS